MARTITVNITVARAVATKVTASQFMPQSIAEWRKQSVLALPAAAGPRNCS
jgi:hypothetical protein